jgi:hypothetical protein
MPRLPCHQKSAAWHWGAAIVCVCACECECVCVCSGLLRARSLESASTIGERRVKFPWYWMGAAVCCVWQGGLDRPGQAGQWTSPRVWSGTSLALVPGYFAIRTQAGARPGTVGEWIQLEACRLAVLELSVCVWSWSWSWSWSVLSMHARCEYLPSADRRLSLLLPTILPPRRPQQQFTPSHLLVLLPASGQAPPHSLHPPTGGARATAFLSPSHNGSPSRA